MRMVSLGLAATCAGLLAAAPGSLASGTRAATAAPARADATAALRSAKAAIAAADLLSARKVAFAFSSASGTCPPGTTDASYCLAAAGRLTFRLVFVDGSRHAQAASVGAHISASSNVSVTAAIDTVGLALLRSARSHHAPVTAEITAEATISATAYFTARGTVKIKY
jgi:hypothetical protein